ncbi:MAG: glycosyltransferase family 9 protein, partial [bacterium]
MPKLLVVKLHALGDVVIHTPALKRLREGLNDWKIEFLTIPWSAPPVYHSVRINKLVLIDNDIFFKPRLMTFFPTLQTWWDLKKEKYDAILVCHRHKMIVTYFQLLNVRRFFAYNLPGRGVLMDEGHHCVMTAWELGNFAAEALGATSLDKPELQDIRLEWFISDEEREEAKNILHRWGLDNESFIVFCPGGGVNPRVHSPDRRWLPEG